MILCIDIGNTNIAAGVRTDEGWRCHFRISTDAERTADEYVVQFAGLLSHHGAQPSDISGVAVSSVVPRLNEVFRGACTALFGSEPFFVSSDADHGLSFATDNPHELGADLLANAVAGYRRANGAVVVVDFGTALSFVAVSGAGEIQGASIAPGLQSAVRALFLNTAQLPSVDLRRPPAAIGTDTPSAINSGIVIGYIGLVERLIHDILAELGGGIAVATGGLAGIIMPHTDVFSAHEPWLTLDGIARIYQRSNAR